MLEIQNNCIVFHELKEYTSLPLYRRHMCAVQVQVCYTSNLIGPKVHNIIHVNRPKVHNIIHVNRPKVHNIIHVNK